MKRYLQILALVLTAVVPAASMSADFALGPRSEARNIRWKSGVIRLAVSTSLTTPNYGLKFDSDVPGALSRSVAAWEAATGLVFRVEASDRQNVSPAGVAGDGVNLITIAQTPENLQLFAKDPFGASAQTRVFYNRRGAITEADIVLNPFQQFSTDGTYGTFDLETTLTHEIGHLLGLKHSAVAGAIMAEHIGRIADPYLGPRSPSAADFAAVRELYGVETDSCCGSISGRLTGLGKNVRGATVWAEDADSRVIGQAEVAADGNYRIGGLQAAKYELYWQRQDSLAASIGGLGAVSVDNGSQTTLSRHLSADKSDFSLAYVGLNMQPGDSAIVVRPGRQYNVCIGGAGFGDGIDSVTFSSKYIHADRSSISALDLGDKVDSVTFAVTIDADAPIGMYTLYAERGDGAKAAIVGAVIVSR